jgi:glycerol kinase
MQLQADVLGVPLVRPAALETTVLGAAYLAGLGIGFWSSPQEVSRAWREDGRFQRRESAEKTEERRSAFRKALALA